MPLALVPGTSSAAIWTPVASGTTETITALDYRPDRTLFGTVNGKLFTVAGGQRASFPGLSVIDVKRNPSGTVAIAALSAGYISRSTDGGNTWSAATRLSTYNTTYSCTPGQPAVALSPLDQDLTSVAWASDSVAYIGNNKPGSMQKTSNAGSTWSEVSRNSTGSCKLSANPTTDIAPVVGSDTVTFVSQYFGDTYVTSDALASNASRRGGSVNCYDKKPSLAVDTDSANRLAAGDRCTGSLSLQYSEDGGSNFARPTIVPDTADVNGEYDVSFTGGTMIWVGNAGDIFTSRDGQTAYSQRADGVNATRDWRTVSAYSGSDAAVGGVAGALVVSSATTSIPDVVAPAGVINAPGPVTAGVAKQFTATLTDNAGGSGIDPASIQWTAPGIPAVTGNPATITFPAATFITLTVSFKDLAGNAGQATAFLDVRAPAPGTGPGAGTITPGGKIVGTVPGASITLQGPTSCVPSGTAFDATMSLRRITIKNNRIVKLTKVTFYVDGKKVKTDKRAPFKQTLKIPASAPGTVHKLKAVGSIKVKRGKAPTKSQTVVFATCA